MQVKATVSRMQLWPTNKKIGKLLQSVLKLCKATCIAEHGNGKCCGYLKGSRSGCTVLRATYDILCIEFCGLIHHLSLWLVLLLSSVVAGK